MHCIRAHVLSVCNLAGSKLQPNTEEFYEELQTTLDSITTGEYVIFLGGFKSRMESKNAERRYYYLK